MMLLPPHLLLQLLNLLELSVHGHQRFTTAVKLEPHWLDVI